MRRVDIWFCCFVGITLSKIIIGAEILDSWQEIRCCEENSTLKIKIFQTLKKSFNTKNKKLKYSKLKELDQEKRLFIFKCVTIEQWEKISKISKSYVRGILEALIQGDNSALTDFATIKVSPVKAIIKCPLF